MRDVHMDWPFVQDSLVAGVPSPLSGAYNRCIVYITSFRPNSPFGRTSDMRQPLSEIAVSVHKEVVGK